MVLISPDGEIRVWENMSLGLGNMDRYQETYIELGQDDMVDKLWKLDVSSLKSMTRRRLADGEGHQFCRNNKTIFGL